MSLHQSSLSGCKDRPCSPRTEPLSGLELDILNQDLCNLSSIFPNVQAEVFREILLNVGDMSRLQIAVESLLEHKVQRVKGRWRHQRQKCDNLRTPTRERGSTKDHDDSLAVPVNERFRSQDYKNAVAMSLHQEFRGLPGSTIDAVLAENNYYYTTARLALRRISARSWWFSVSSFFLRRKRPQSDAADEHPLVLWLPRQGGGNSEPVPTVKHTGSVELNREILESVVQPLRAGIVQRQVEGDREVALQLNEAEAERGDALYDCECCFTPSTFEHLSACDQDGHVICVRCVRHAVSEAVFGQSWRCSIDCRRGTLRCLAPSAGAGGDACEGHIPFELVSRALLAESDGRQMLRQLEEKLAAEGLNASNLPLLRCPFCPYAEVDDFRPDLRRCLRLRTNSLQLPLGVVASVGLLAIFPGCIALAILVALALLGYLVATGFQPLLDSLVRIARRRRGLRFTCRAPLCGRASCVNCGKEWRDIHICYESERVALREHVERAMVNAVKRTCPRCNLSFVKSSGCNKLTCVCGYSMCYVCRAAIDKDGYRHFCEHFRPTARASCGDCNKCDLYRCEDDDTAALRAAQEAETQWWAAHVRRKDPINDPLQPRPSASSSVSVPVSSSTRDRQQSGLAKTVVDPSVDKSVARFDPRQSRRKLPSATEILPLRIGVGSLGLARPAHTAWWRAWTTSQIVDYIVERAWEV
ncbi:MAG: hypothetical protein M1815_001192 [Lichina confinis]|nr:MAG: hypothetical protein M1815_001192 [Lichina confinis]